ncbi:hypothetical protein [uncultured Alistipes sp.]|uniref:hypothetical protein n=1 Tax=uncultured Alistipes sp. TaxID=538949 RepID=UPI0025F06C41|nr:hypothetical protein [uncultured Alistipes sp.]
MKRLFSTFALALAALCLNACSGGPKPGFTANAMGVGPVLLCLDTDLLPPAREGLYDAFSREEISDSGVGYTRLTFTLSGARVIEALVYDNQIESIVVLSPGIGSTDAIYPGTKVKELLKKGGNPEPDSEGRLMIELNGLLYSISGLTEEAAVKLQDAYASGIVPQIDASDFEKDAKVENILIN